MNECLILYKNSVLIKFLFKFDLPRFFELSPEMVLKSLVEYHHYGHVQNRAY